MSRPQNDRIHLYASKGAAAQREKYSLAVRQAWARLGGLRSKGVPKKKKQPTGESVQIQPEQRPKMSVDAILAQIEAIERR